MYPIAFAAFATAVCCVSSGSAPAKDVYIAQDSAGSNTGGDCANAHSAAWFNRSWHWGNGPSDIGPGRTVHLCGIITGEPQGIVLAVQGSGTADEPITIRWEPGASVSAPYCGAANVDQGCIIVSTPKKPRSYITLDGGTPCGPNRGPCNGTIVNSANGVGLKYQQNTQAIEMENCTGCEVKNLGIYNLYIESGGDTRIDQTEIRCITWSGSNNRIHDSTMHDVGWCLIDSYRDGNTANEIYNNDISNVDHAMTLSSGGANTGGGFSFHDNHIHDYANWDAAGCPYHHDGIHGFGNKEGVYPTVTTFYIYNNLFDGKTGNCKTGHIYLSSDWTTERGGPAYIFNNVAVVDSHDGNGIVSYSNGTGTLIVNNTIVNTGDIEGICLNWSNLSSGATMTFKNNAISGCSTLINSDTSGHDAGVVADFNVYANCNSFHCWSAFVPGTSDYAVYQSNPWHQEQGAGDAHSGKRVSRAKLSGALGLNRSTWVPDPGSMVIRAGENLTKLCSGELVALCKDRGGNPRPTIGPWDAGAYSSDSSPK